MRFTRKAKYRHCKNLQGEEAKYSIQKQGHEERRERDKC